MVSCPTWSKNLWRYLVMLYIDCHWREFSLKRTCALQNHVKYHIPVFNITIIRWQSQKAHALLGHPQCLHLHNKTPHSGINLSILIKVIKHKWRGEQFFLEQKLRFVLVFDWFTDKKIWANYEQLLRAFFSCFLG